MRRFATPGSSGASPLALLAFALGFLGLVLRQWFDWAALPSHRAFLVGTLASVTPVAITLLGHWQSLPEFDAAAKIAFALSFLYLAAIWVYYILVDVGVPDLLSWIYLAPAPVLGVIALVFSRLARRQAGSSGG